MVKLRPDESVFEGFEQHRIDVDDVDDENLLEHFPAAIQFIQSGLDAGGSVLIHWLVSECFLPTVSYTASQQTWPHIL